MVLSDSAIIEKEYMDFLDGKSEFPSDILSKGSSAEVSLNRSNLRRLYICVARKYYDSNLYRLVYDFTTHPELEKKYGLYQYHYYSHKKRFLKTTDSYEKRCIKTRKENSVHFFSELFQHDPFDSIYLLVPITIDQYKDHLKGNRFPNNFFDSKKCESCLKDSSPLNNKCLRRKSNRAWIIFTAFLKNHRGKNLSDMVFQYEHDGKDIKKEDFSKELYHANMYAVYKYILDMKDSKFEENKDIHKRRFMHNKDILEKLFAETCDRFAISRDAIPEFLDKDFNVLFKEYDNTCQNT